MKKLAIALFLILVCPALVCADSITLNTNETLSVPESARISDWEIIKINADQKIMTIRYRWRAGDDTVVQLGNRQGWQFWTCQDRETPGTNAECLAAGDPYECCTGVGTGTCDDLLDSCFSDVFGFTIRSQDVGTKIGIGLRTLIWNQMKQDVLSGGNDGAFDSE